MSPPPSEHTCETTRYGFAWGPLTVERVAEIDGRVVVSLKTAHRELQIACSKQGRSLKVYEVARRRG